jgi:16S rRNA (adenine1518-N6/adenine1519-N6)-dimethyltransferase
MVEILKETLKDFKNVEIVQGDILKLDPKPYTLKPYKVVANLPYYIVAPVIRKFLEGVEVKPRQMILMVQKEVAQRICNKPPKMSILAVSVQFYAKPEILFYVPRNSFWPRPAVDGAIIKIVPHQFRAPVSRQFRERFFKIAKAGFSQPRKQLCNNLAKGLKLNKEKTKNWLLENQINPIRRAETLSIKDWLNLTKTY